MGFRALPEVHHGCHVYDDAEINSIYTYQDKVCNIVNAAQRTGLLIAIAPTSSQGQTGSPQTKLRNLLTSSQFVNSAREPANCNPALCDAMVAAGKCTPEQAAKCKAKMASTKVASAKLSREEGKAVNVSTKAEVKTKSCAKTCSKMSAKTAKKSIP